MRNLSAVSYELGNYQICIEQANRAILLMKAEGVEDSDKQFEALRDRIARAARYDYHPSAEDQIERRLILLKELGRYRGSMQSVTDYFPVGTDKASSLYKPSSIGKAKDHSPNSSSFFLGSVGDARHLLQTLIVVAKAEPKDSASKRTYHFTANDIHKGALARNLIIWLLLDELAFLEPDSGPALKILNTIFFTFVSAVMPDYAHHQLKNIIKRALWRLRSGLQPLDWMHVPIEDFEVYIFALRRWNGEVKERTRSIDLMTEIRAAMWRNDLSSSFSGLKGRCGKEKMLHSCLAFLCPSTKVLESCDPYVLKLWNDIGVGHLEKVIDLGRHMAHHWYPNITLLNVNHDIVDGVGQWFTGTILSLS